MSEENLKLWDSVEKTNPEHTKAFKGKGGFKGTAISAQYQIKTATSIWGPMGYNWGLKEDSYKKESSGDDYHNDVLIYKAVFYYPIEDKIASFNMETEIDLWNYSKAYSEWSKNNDPRKKARTDLLTKCLSQLGFNADVFMGMFDDNKYVNDLKTENEKENQAKEREIITGQLYNLERRFGDVEEGDEAKEECLKSYSLMDMKSLKSSLDSIKLIEKKHNAINYAKKVLEEKTRAKSKVDQEFYPTNTKEGLRNILISIRTEYGKIKEVDEMFRKKTEELENNSIEPKKSEEV